MRSRDLFACNMEQQSNRSHRPAKEKKKYEGTLLKRSSSQSLTDLHAALNCTVKSTNANIVIIRTKPKGLCLCQSRKTQ